MLNQLGQMLWSLLTLSNIHIRIAITAMLLAQVIKIFTYSLKHKQFNFKVFVRTGGMPSSHTAMVAGLATSVGIAQGWNSVSFAVAIIFSFIVMYDAAGVRRAAGRQAVVLNKILDDIIKAKSLKEERLKEFLGHTPVEVLVGFIFGALIAFLMHGIIQ